MADRQIGEITHCYDKISVGVLALTDTIRLGDTIHILGHTTDFQQQVVSLQVDHKEVETAGPGDDVALKVDERVREGDKVFRVLDEQ